MMALGGVAIGNMNAQLELSVAGMINNRGLIPRFFASVTTIGKNVAVAAVLVASSVKNSMMRLVINMTRKSGTVFETSMN